MSLCPSVFLPGRVKQTLINTGKRSSTRFGGGKVFGSDETNVEAWKPLKRLVGHESDVADIAWNHDDSMIASVGLDSTIFIWNGYTFGRC